MNNAFDLSMSWSYLITNVELSASGGWPCWWKVGKDNGGKHGAPTTLHYHHTEDFTLGFWHHHLWKVEIVDFDAASLIGGIINPLNKNILPADLTQNMIYKQNEKTIKVNHIIMYVS